MPQNFENLWSKLIVLQQDFANFIKWLNPRGVFELLKCCHSYEYLAPNKVISLPCILVQLIPVAQGVAKLRLAKFGIHWVYSILGHLKI